MITSGLPDITNLLPWIASGLPRIILNYSDYPDYSDYLDYLEYCRLEVSFSGLQNKYHVFVGLLVDFFITGLLTLPRILIGLLWITSKLPEIISRLPRLTPD